MNNNEKVLDSLIAPDHAQTCWELHSHYRRDKLGLVTNVIYAKDRQASGTCNCRLTHRDTLLWALTDTVYQGYAWSKSSGFYILYPDMSNHNKLYTVSGASWMLYGCEISKKKKCISAILGVVEKYFFSINISFFPMYTKLNWKRHRTCNWGNNRFWVMRTVNHRFLEGLKSHWKELLWIFRLLARVTWQIINPK